MRPKTDNALLTEIDPVFDLVAEQASQREVAEVVGAHVGLEAVGGAGERQAEYAGVIHQYINRFHGVGELAHAGQVGQIQVTRFDVAGHFGGGLLGLGDGPAGNRHAVSGGGQRRSGRFADAAIAAGDDDAHRGSPRVDFYGQDHCRRSRRDSYSRACARLRLKCPPNRRGGPAYSTTSFSSPRVSCKRAEPRSTALDAG